MARNHTVTADAHAPAVTEQLARFVTSHPSRGWSDAVDAEAHRTFANWAGCAIDPSGHIALLAKVEAIVDDRILEASVDIAILNTDGRECHFFVEHASGSVDKPMSNAPLRVKFVGQAEPVLGATKAARDRDLSMGITNCAHLGEFFANTT